jgi:hypothetical protein
MIVKSYVRKPKSVDFAQYEASGPMQYFTDKRPFYTRESFSKRLLARIVGS